MNRSEKKEKTGWRQKNHFKINNKNWLKYDDEIFVLTTLKLRFNITKN